MRTYWVKTSENPTAQRPKCWYKDNNDQRGASPVMCGMLNSFHPAAVGQTAVYMSLNGAESSRTAEEGRLWIKATRIPTMFQFRPTTRRFSVLVCVCVCVCFAGMDC